MSTNKTEIDYPPAKRDESSFVTMHNQKIPDYYVSLENDKNFLDDQTKLANKILTEKNCRQNVISKMKTIANFERRNLPHKIGNTYFYTANSGTQKYDVLYRTENLTQPKGEIVFNLNDAEESEATSFNNWCVSQDGKMVVLCIGEKSKESILIQAVKCKKPDKYELIKDLDSPVKIAWFEKGFFYSTSDVIKYHTLGNSPKKDEIVFKVKQENASVRLTPIMSDDEKYLFIFVESTEYLGHILFFARPKKDKSKSYQMVVESDKFFKYITNINEFAFFLTSKKAATNRVIRINMNNRKPLCHCEWAEIISRDKDSVLVDAIFAGGEYVILSYMRECSAFLRIHSLITGRTTHEINQGFGTITIRRLSNPNDTEFFYMFESLHIPPIIYRVSITDTVKSQKPPVIVFQSTPSNYCSSDYFLDRLTFLSSDKRKQIPMYIAGKKTSKNKQGICILKVCGGFGKIYWPKFCVYTFAFYQIYFGIVAIVFVRGGGEKGRKWHNSGRLLKKINSIQDYQVAAEVLFQGKYTTNNQLVAFGACNGALIVAASMVQKPQLFSLALMINPLTDMIKFKQSNILLTEYGDIKSCKKKLANILKYSPLHNIKIPTKVEEAHPIALIFCNVKDRNFEFWHASKFTAALQYCAKQSKFCKITLLKKIENFDYYRPNFYSNLEFYADQYTMITKFVK